MRNSLPLSMKDINCFEIHDSTENDFHSASLVSDQLEYGIVSCMLLYSCMYSENDVNNFF